MNYTLEAIQLKENGNKDCIYIYYIEGAWRAFGQSAYYVHRLYPELRIKEDGKLSATGRHISIPDNYVLCLSEENHALVGDNYIQVKVPVTLLSQKDEK